MSLINDAGHRWPCPLFFRHPESDAVCICTRPPLSTLDPEEGEEP